MATKSTDRAPTNYVPVVFYLAVAFVAGMLSALIFNSVRS